MIRHNLSISNFKRKIRVILQIVGLLGVFFIGCKMMDYLYVQEEDWSRILWHNFYRQKENIDCVYIGASHVYCDLNPEILDERNGKNNFNLATGNQRLIESYYLLIESERKNKIEQVYLELFYGVSTGIAGNYTDSATVKNSWRNTDYMKVSHNRINGLFHMNSKQYYMDAIFPFIRYREHLADSNWIKERTNKKQEENYRNFILKREDVEYSNKGYCYQGKALENFYCGRKRIPDEMYLTEDAEYYLRKIIEYCHNKKIPIVLFSSPMYELEVISTGQYDNYINDIKKIAEEYEIPYYDFNLVKEEYLSIQKPEMFSDTGHLNGNGAELFTNFFYEIVSSQPEDTEKYFYNSYEEKLASTEPEVFGIYYRDIEETELQEGEELEKTSRVIIGSNRNEELEYQIYNTYEEGNTVLLQDFSINKEFNLPSFGHGVCKIVWRKIGDYKNTHELVINYNTFIWILWRII